jgi:hypothetical protein
MNKNKEAVSKVVVGAIAALAISNIAMAVWL